MAMLPGLSNAEVRARAVAKLKRAASLPRINGGRRPPMYSEGTNSGENMKLRDDANDSSRHADISTKANATSDAYEAHEECESPHEPPNEPQPFIVTTPKRKRNPRPRSRSRSRSRSKDLKDLQSSKSPSSRDSVKPFFSNTVDSDNVLVTPATSTEVLLDPCLPFAHSTSIPPPVVSTLRDPVQLAVPEPTGDTPKFGLPQNTSDLGSSHKNTVTSNEHHALGQDLLGGFQYPVDGQGDKPTTSSCLIVPAPPKRRRRRSRRASGNSSGAGASAVVDDRDPPTPSPNTPIVPPSPLSVHTYPESPQQPLTNPTSQAWELWRFPSPPSLPFEDKESYAYGLEVGEKWSHVTPVSQKQWASDMAPPRRTRDVVVEDDEDMPASSSPPPPSLPRDPHDSQIYSTRNSKHRVQHPPDNSSSVISTSGKDTFLNPSAKQRAQEEEEEIVYPEELSAKRIWNPKFVNGNGIEWPGIYGMKEQDIPVQDDDEDEDVHATAPLTSQHLRMSPPHNDSHISKFTPTSPGSTSRSSASHPHVLPPLRTTATALSTNSSPSPSPAFTHFPNTTGVFYPRPESCSDTTTDWEETHTDEEAPSKHTFEHPEAKNRARMKSVLVRRNGLSFGRRSRANSTSSREGEVVNEKSGASGMSGEAEHADLFDPRSPSTSISPVMHTQLAKAQRQKQHLRGDSGNRSEPTSPSPSGTSYAARSLALSHSHAATTTHQPTSSSGYSPAPVNKIRSMPHSPKHLVSCFDIATDSDEMHTDEEAPPKRTPDGSEKSTSIGTKRTFVGKSSPSPARRSRANSASTGEERAIGGRSGASRTSKKTGSAKLSDYGSPSTASLSAWSSPGEMRTQLPQEWPQQHLVHTSPVSTSIPPRRPGTPYRPNTHRHRNHSPVPPASPTDLSKYAGPKLMPFPGLAKLAEERNMRRRSQGVVASTSTSSGLQPGRTSPSPDPSFSSQPAEIEPRGRKHAHQLSDSGLLHAFQDTSIDNQLLPSTSTSTSASGTSWLPMTRTELKKWYKANSTTMSPVSPTRMAPGPEALDAEAGARPAGTQRKPTLDEMPANHPSNDTTIGEEISVKRTPDSSEKSTWAKVKGTLVSRSGSISRQRSRASSTGKGEEQMTLTHSPAFASFPDMADVLSSRRESYYNAAVDWEGSHADDEVSSKRIPDHPEKSTWTKVKGTFVGGSTSASSRRSRTNSTSTHDGEATYRKNTTGGTSRKTERAKSFDSVPHLTSPLTATSSSAIPHAQEQQHQHTGRGMRGSRSDSRNTSEAGASTIIDDRDPPPISKNMPTAPPSPLSLRPHRRSDSGLLQQFRSTDVVDEFPPSTSNQQTGSSTVGDASLHTSQKDTKRYTDNNISNSSIPATFISPNTFTYEAQGRSAFPFEDQAGMFEVSVGRSPDSDRSVTIDLPGRTIDFVGYYAGTPASDEVPASHTYAGKDGPILTGRIKIVDGPRCAGGFCDVYTGELTSRRGTQLVAMKMLRVFNKEDHVVKAKKKFRREVDLWRLLRHPYVLPFYGTCTLDEFRLFMVSPWAIGGNALEYLRRKPSAHRGQLLWQVSSALEYLHSGQDNPKIVHGDLKADNVLISSTGDALLCDFGLSRYVEEIITKSGSSSGRGGGHARFMAPELIYRSGENAQPCRPTPESDVFAFALLMLQIYTEKLPFSDMSEVPAMFKLVKGELPTRPTESVVLERGLDDYIWEVMLDCWQLLPSSRPSMKVVMRRMRSHVIPPLSLPVSGTIELDSQRRPSEQRPMAPLSALAPKQEPLQQLWAQMVNDMPERRN